MDNIRKFFFNVNFNSVSDYNSVCRGELGQSRDVKGLNINIIWIPIPSTSVSYIHMNLMFLATHTTSHNPNILIVPALDGP